MSPILHVARGKVRSSGSQRPTGEVVLVVNIVGGLVVVCMMMSLLCRVRMVTLGLKLRHLHAEALVSLAAIHQDMLPLVCLTVHSEWIERSCLAKGRRS